MAEELGKIEKPEVEQFTGKKKLYLVPLIFYGENAPPEYMERFNLYWEQVSQQVANLESKIGKVTHLYHESITLAGEDGLKVIEKLNPSCYQIAKDKCQSGAVLEVTEDKELAEENMDWERFLLMGFVSQKVAKMVSEFYMETSRKRYEGIARRMGFGEVSEKGFVGHMARDLSCYPTKVVTTYPFGYDKEVIPIPISASLFIVVAFHIGLERKLDIFHICRPSL